MTRGRRSENGRRVLRIGRGLSNSFLPISREIGRPVSGIAVEHNGISCASVGGVPASVQIIVEERDDEAGGTQRFPYAIGVILRDHALVEIRNQLAKLDLGGAGGKRLPR